ncbi:hypothetical protein [Chryseobacterium sp. 22458]|uniref:hypothetical protein n=1 Tax=Chryseobacterium sp. 22458 TaxID=3453921 RepID=UPI003F82F697
MMNHPFSLHSIVGGRLFLLLFLFVNFQIISAAYTHETTSSELSTPPTSLFISEGTIISGMEKVYVSHVTKDKVRKKSKKKVRFTSNKRKQKKKEIISQPVNNNKRTEIIFRRGDSSEKSSLLAVSDGDMQIVRPDNHTMKFFLPVPADTMPVLICLRDVFLKKFSKSQALSSFRLFQNFNRPPPVLYSTIA